MQRRIFLPLAITLIGVDRAIAAALCRPHSSKTDTTLQATTSSTQPLDTSTNITPTATPSTTLSSEDSTTEVPATGTLTISESLTTESSTILNISNTPTLTIETVIITTTTASTTEFATTNIDTAISETSTTQLETSAADTEMTTTSVASATESSTASGFTTPIAADTSSPAVPSATGSREFWFANTEGTPAEVPSKDFGDSVVFHEGGGDIFVIEEGTNRLRVAGNVYICVKYTDTYSLAHLAVCPGTIPDSPNINYGDIVTCAEASDQKITCSARIGVCYTSSCSRVDGTRYDQFYSEESFSGDLYLARGLTSPNVREMQADYL